MLSSPYGRVNVSGGIHDSALTACWGTRAARPRSTLPRDKLPFTLLSDPERKVMQAWGAYGDKMMYGKKTKGVIRSTVWVGPDGVVRKHWRRVTDAAKLPAQVLEAIRG